MHNRECLCKSLSFKKHDQINKFLQHNQHKHMRIPISSFLLATLFLTTAVVPAQANPALPLIGSGIGELIKFFSRKNEIKKEKIRADAKTKEIEAQIKLEELRARNNADPNLAMIQSWGLTVTNCSSSAVSISMDGKQYCTNAANWLNAGRYQYIRAEDRLEPMYQLSQPLNTNTNSQIEQDYEKINTNTNSQPQTDNDGSL